MNEQNVEELKKKGAKLKACNERSRERIAEIAKTANDCLLNTIHPDVYVAGQYGQDYRTFGKAMCEIRKIVEDSIADVAPDYEMLARQFSRPCFDADKLAKAIEALASEKPVDYPTFYTPGWLVDLAKKICGSETLPPRGGAVSAAPTGETPVAQVDESPAVSGCPSLGPKVFPSGADGTEPAEPDKNPFFEFYGLKLNRFGGAGLNSKLIGKRVNVDMSVQVFEIEVKRGNLATGARAFVTENGELLFSIVGGKSFAVVENLAISALHSLLKRRFDNNKRKNIRRARKAAAKRAAKNGGAA